MDYRNNYNTPREHIDNDLLLRILEEREPASCNYGGRRHNSNTRNILGTQCSERGITSREEVSSTICPNDDACAKKSCLSAYPAAMGFFHDQEWKDMYNDEDAMHHGTIFCELHKPFYHGCSGNCR